MAKSSPLRRLGATPVTAWWLAYHSVVLVLWYTSAWLVLGTTLLPGGAGFALCVVYLAAALGGRLVRLLSSRLPPLLGMLLAGLVMGNSSPAILATIKEPLFLGHDFSWWSAVLRTTALAIIMLRAGLGLNLDKLRKMGFATARLAFMPCLLEATVVGLLAAAVLGFPPGWGGLLGFVVAAVSPAVVVPGMLDLQARRLGTGKGIPTLVMAAASFDDVISIAGFGICLALALSDGSQSLLWLVFKAPVEIFAGVGIGIVFGCWAAVPSAQQLDVTTHTLCVLGASLLSVFGGKELQFSGGGALGAVVLGAAAATWWLQDRRACVQAAINRLWAFAQPALFGLLGAAVRLESFDARVGQGIAVLVVGMAVRLLTTRIATIGCGLSTQEAHFVCLAWIPKATVQAAVGGTALDMVTELNLGNEAKRRAELILMLSVLIILMTAPLGAVCVALTGPRWLAREEDAKEAAPSCTPTLPVGPLPQCEAPALAPETVRPQAPHHSETHLTAITTSLSLP